MLFDILKESIKISLFVFGMMVLVDFLSILTKGRFGEAIKGKVWRQYFVSSSLGVTPGCLGAFLNVSLYGHGLLSLGAIVGGMIATSGDEAFVMLSLFPENALLLFGILFLSGLFFSRVTDFLAPRLKIRPCEECILHEYHSEKASPRHYIVDHLWGHIIKKHLIKIFLWTFLALLVLEFGLKNWDLELFVQNNLGWVMLIAALVGVIPESGPHLIFVMMFHKGMIPFSVLLVSSFVQDGHGMLPLFSYSVKDFITIKAFNLGFGLILGVILLILKL